MHVSKLDINGTSLVGLYIFPLDDVVLVGSEVSSDEYSLIEDVFGAKVLPLTIAGTSLIGVFLATDGKKLLVPSLIFDHEKDILDKSKIPYIVVETKNTCLGNNVVFTTKGMVCNAALEKSAIDQISEFLNVPVHLADADVPTIGSFLVCNDNFGLVSHDVSDDQIEQLGNYLGIRLTPGTVNMGGAQVSGGVAVNNKGFIIGMNSGGPEIMNADHALGFIGD